MQTIASWVLTCSSIIFFKIVPEPCTNSAPSSRFFHSTKPTNCLMRPLRLSVRRAMRVWGRESSTQHSRQLPARSRPRPSFGALKRARLAFVTKAPLEEAYHTPQASQISQLQQLQLSPSSSLQKPFRKLCNKQISIEWQMSTFPSGEDKGLHKQLLRLLLVRP